MMDGLAKKLRYDPASPALVINAPAGFLAAAGIQAQEGIEEKQKYPFVLLFVRNQDEFNQLFASVLPAVEPDKLFWLAFPKKTGAIESDLSRDILWKLVEISGCGMRPVSNVAIDESWSALRFRPINLVRK